jgi:competence protein ComEC
MASSAAEAPLAWGFLPTNGGGGYSARCARRLERWLEAEREQLVLWLPVLLGAGIAAWFVLPDAGRWIGFLLAGWRCGAGDRRAMLGGRSRRAVLVAALRAAAGCALIWWRAESVAAPVLARPAVTCVPGTNRAVEHLPARELVRLTLVPLRRADLPAGAGQSGGKDLPEGVARGATSAAGAADAAAAAFGARRL